MVSTSVFLGRADYCRTKPTETGEADLLQVELSYSADEIVSAHLHCVSADDNERPIIYKNAIPCPSQYQICIIEYRLFLLY